VTSSTCIQINLQRGFGGGEVYTAAFARALSRLGVENSLLVHPDAAAWSSLPMPGTHIVPLEDSTHLVRQLRGEPRRWLAFHTFAPPEVVGELRSQGHLATAFAHMPLYGRDPRPLLAYELVLAVSQHVIRSIHGAGIGHVFEEPIYGAVHFERTAQRSNLLRSRSRYDWDRHKVRDRALAALEPLWRGLKPERVFARHAGLTLGIVSRITPIKQFPLMFSRLAAVLARFPTVHLEIFGSGGYASVRDLVRSLAPIGERVRFWGHQADVVAVYKQIDFLLTGLPEKEALGLNVIEAQACGTPVLAPDAPPFDETVVHGVTGLRYRDPREDDGAGFERALRLVLGGHFRFDAESAKPHLARFTEDAFVERVRLLATSLGLVAALSPERS
jgi:glycosyltransferase involved in cell wall biosynthesis